MTSPDDGERAGIRDSDKTGGSAVLNFERPEIGKKAIDFADDLYHPPRAFPEAERFNLAHQMRGAAASISSNIAEGYSRASHQDFDRFIEIATGSVFEVISQATMSRRQGIFPRWRMRLSIG